MVKNLKKYRKELEKEGSVLLEKENLGLLASNSAATAAANASGPVPGSGGGGGGGGAGSGGLGGAGGVGVAGAPLPGLPSPHYSHFDFFPITYTMPGEYAVFLEEFKRLPGSVWILKPNGKSQGKGIEIFYKLSQAKRWAASVRMASMSARDSYVISRYIANPLLIGGKKFDLRLYCLVTSYRPLKAWFFREGFARFCNVKYSHALSDMDEVEMHLTNVAIQKHGDEYNDSHGNKWTLNNLRLYILATRGAAKAQRMMDQIHFIMIHSLKAVAAVMQNDKHCFECYGYDLLLDEELKPWLLEINASPSLSTTTKSDRNLKTKLISDLLKVVVPPDFPE